MTGSNAPATAGAGAGPATFYFGDINVYAGTDISGASVGTSVKTSIEQSLRSLGYKSTGQRRV